MDTFRRGVSGVSWAAAREASAHNDAVINAVTSFSVNVVGVLVLGAVYMNYVLLADHIRPLFWAGILSIPLHQLKKNLVRRVVHDARRRGGGAWTGLSGTLFKVILQKSFGPVFVYPARLIRAYFHVVASISDVEERQDVPPESPGSGSSSSGDDEPDPPSPGPLPGLGRATSASASNLGLGLGLTSDPHKTDSELSPSSAYKAMPMHKAVSETGISQASSDKPHFERRGSTDSPSMAHLDTQAHRSGSIDKRAAPKAASVVYFSFMLRACGLYIMYKILVLTGRDYLVVVGFGLTAIMGAHLAYHIALRLLKSYLGDPIGKLKARIRDSIQRADDKTLHLGSKLYSLLIKQPLEWSYARYRQSRKEAKSVFVQNANSVIATLLVAGSILGVVALFAFLVFNFVYEANLLMEWCISAVDQSLSNEMREQFRSALESGYSAAIDFGNAKLKEFYPASQITIEDIYNKMFDVRNRTMTSTAVATVREPMFLGMPQTSALVMSIADGGVASLADPSKIMACVHELRAAGLDTLHTMYRTSGYDQYVSMATDYLSTFATSIFSGTLGVLISAMNFVMEATKFFFQVVLFVLAFHYLIANKYAITDYLSRLLSLADPQQYIRQTLETSIRGVLLVTLKMAVFHFLFTWLTFSVLGVEIIYIPAFFSAVFAAIPVVSPYLLAIPASLSLYLRGRAALAVLLFLSHFGVSVTVDVAIYNEIPDVSPFFSGMAILLGLYTFGIEGVVLGPLFMAVIPATYHLMAHTLGHEQRGEVQDPGPMVSPTSVHKPLKSD